MFWNDLKNVFKCQNEDRNFTFDYPLRHNNLTMTPVDKSYTSCFKNNTKIGQYLFLKNVQNML